MTPRAMKSDRRGMSGIYFIGRKRGVIPPSILASGTASATVTQSATPSLGPSPASASPELHPGAPGAPEPAGLDNVPVGAACDASQTTAVIATLGDPARLEFLRTTIVPGLAKSMAMREVVVLWQDPTKPTPSISLARVVRMPNSSLNNRYRVPLLATCSAFLLDDDHMCDQKCVDSLWPSWNHAYFAAIASGCKQPDEPRRRRADASCRM